MKVSRALRKSIVDGVMKRLQAAIDDWEQGGTGTGYHLMASLDTNEAFGVCITTDPEVFRKIIEIRDYTAQTSTKVEGGLSLVSLPEDPPEVPPERN